MCHLAAIFSLNYFYNGEPFSYHAKKIFYSLRYDFVKKHIERTKAQTVIDLGCAECKFVKELAKMDLRRVIGIDLDRHVIDNGSNYFKPNFDDYNSPYYQRKENLLIELYRFVHWALRISLRDF